MLKRCRRCCLDLPLDNFGPHPDCEYGRQPRCRQCVREAARQRNGSKPWAEHVEQIKAAAASRALAGQKRCTKCNTEKPLSDFNNDPSKGDGKRAQCRACARDRRAKRTPEQREKQRKQTLAWQKKLSPERRQERYEKYQKDKRSPEQRQGERAKAAARKGRVYTAGVSKAEGRRIAIRARGGLAISHAERRARDRAESAERWPLRLAELAAKRAARILAKPWTDPALTSAEAFRLQYRLDPEFAIKQRLRASAKRKRQGVKIGDLLRGALKRDGRSPTIERFAGFTIPELKRHLERQFDRRMSWQSFCAGEIHIDHIRPLASFDLANPEELRAAWTITNLRPLWKPDNLAKGAKRTHLL